MSSVKIIHNKKQFLTPSVLDVLFRPGYPSYVDKVLTGNGFTTAFVKIRPKFGMVNVLIEPNISVVKDKEEAYLRRSKSEIGFGFEKAKIGFVYEGNPLRFPVDYYNVIVCVADSFVHKEKVWGLRGRVDKLVVDEYHTAEIQSGFRDALVQLRLILKEHYESNCSICYATATPNKYAEITHQIKNLSRPRQNVNLSFSVGDTIERIVMEINKGSKVSVFSNDAHIVNWICQRAQIKNINLRVGDNFKATLFQLGLFEHDSESNVSFHSSKDFEGWDDYRSEVNVFIFCDIQVTHNCFLPSQIVQALGRTRKGFGNAEICRYSSSNKLNWSKHVLDHSVEELVTRFIESKSLMANKMKNNHGFWYKGFNVQATALFGFIYFDTSDPEIKLKKRDGFIRVFREMKEQCTSMDLEYFKIRGYSLVQIGEFKKRTIPNKFPVKERKLNFIKENIKINNAEKILPKIFIDRLKFFGLRNKVDSRRSWNRKMQRLALEAVNDFIFCSLNPSGMVLSLKALLMDEGLYNRFYAIHRSRVQCKGYTLKEKRKAISGFKDRGFRDLLLVSIGICFKKPYNNIVGFRNYSPYAQLGMGLIKEVGNRLGVQVKEVDIRSCNPRIIYALNGLDLPNEFYGERKKNKRKINSHLNNFFYQPNRRTSKRNQRREAIVKFEELGFHPVVVTWLMSNFFEGFRLEKSSINKKMFNSRTIVGSEKSCFTRGVERFEMKPRYINIKGYKIRVDFDNANRSRLFDIISFFERQIILDVTRRSKDYNQEDAERFIIRRHDSLVYFTPNDKPPRFGFLNYFKFLGIGGFFSPDNNLYDVIIETQFVPFGVGPCPW